MDGESDQLRPWIHSGIRKSLDSIPFDLCSIIMSICRHVVVPMK